MAEYRYIEIAPRAGFAVVRFHNERLVDDTAITNMADELTDVVRRADSPRLVLDFSGVTRMSSMMLGTLIMLQKRVRQKGGRLALCGIDPELREVFVVARLDQSLNIQDTEADATAALGP